MITNDKKELILSTLEEFTGVNRRNILSKNRRKEYVRVRAMYAYFLRSHEKMSYVGVGRIIHRDHSTIRNLCRIIFMDDELMMTYNLFVNKYKKEYEKFIENAMAD